MATSSSVVHACCFMKRHLLLLFFSGVIFATVTVAQPTRTYPVKAGEIPSEVIPKRAVYLLPDFKDGRVLLRDGTFSSSRFNYNFLLDEMHFIGPKGDTLAIAEPLLIKSVLVDSMEFYFQKGYLRRVFTAGAYKLTIKQQMMQLPDKTRAGYDAGSSSSSINTYGAIYNGKKYDLEVKKDVVFRETFSYYIGTNYNRFLKASKKNFHVLFANKDIEKFIDEHKINFNKEVDLENLLKFCAE